jgi:predicted transglutaminase-like cysteine proteinase
MEIGRKDYQGISQLARPRQLLTTFLLVAWIALWAGLPPAMGLDAERMLASLLKLGGTESGLRNWQRLVAEAGAMAPAENKLRRVNEFFNRHIFFVEDQEVWGQSDYWATPMELLAKGKGDCEDFTIAKYFTLLNAGIADEQLRLVYVKARIGGPNSNLMQAHMVLAYYPTPDAEPLVLDNLITDIRPASRRPDLTPVFSFNSQGIWQGAGGKDPQGAGGIGRLSRWQDLLRRARLEGFD